MQKMISRQKRALLLLDVGLKVRVVSVLADPDWKPELFQAVPEQYRELATECRDPDYIIHNTDIVVGELEKDPEEEKYPNVFELVSAIEQLDAVHGGFRPSTMTQALNKLLGQATFALLRFLIERPGALEELRRLVKL